MERRLPEPGDTIAGKYTVVRVIGSGGMGLVVQARHKKLEHIVAIKLLRPQHAARPDALMRFEREAKALAKISSPYVVKVVDVDVDATTELPFIVMEHLSGHDLATELRRRSTIPIEEAVDWMLQACAGLHEVHALGLVHRDIKPANLFVTSGDPRVLKVMDFGISKLVGGDVTELTTTGEIVGTPSFMAPEQLLSQSVVDPRSDIWALGVVLYRVLSGKLPFAADTAAGLAVNIATRPPVPLQELAPHVPAPLVEATMRALDRDLDRRPANMAELSRWLAPFGSGRVDAVHAADAPLAPHVSARPVDPEPETVVQVGRLRRRGVWVAAVAIGCGAVAAIGALTAGGERPASPATVPVRNAPEPRAPTSSEPNLLATSDAGATDVAVSVGSAAGDTTNAVQTAAPSRKSAPPRRVAKPAASPATKPSAPKPPGTATANDEPLHL